MKYYTIPPTPKLADYVGFFWVKRNFDKSNSFFTPLTFLLLTKLNLLLCSFFKFSLYTINKNHFSVTSVL